MTVKTKSHLAIPSINKDNDQNIISTIKETLKQAIRYGLVGGFNTGLDADLYLALTRVPGWILPAVAAKTISYAAGMASSFTLNYHWTFKFRGSRWQAAGLFLLSNLAALGINAGVLFFTLTILSVPDPAALLFATAAAWGWNFLLYKFVVFQNKSRV